MFVIKLYYWKIFVGSLPEKRVQAGHENWRHLACGNWQEREQGSDRNKEGYQRQTAHNTFLLKDSPTSSKMFHVQLYPLSTEENNVCLQEYFFVYFKGAIVLNYNIYKVITKCHLYYLLGQEVVERNCSVYNFAQDFILNFLPWTHKFTSLFMH